MIITRISVIAVKDRKIIKELAKTSSFKAGELAKRYAFNYLLVLTTE